MLVLVLSYGKAGHTQTCRLLGQVRFVGVVVALAFNEAAGLAIELLVTSGDLVCAGWEVCFTVGRGVRVTVGVVVSLGGGPRRGSTWRRCWRCLQGNGRHECTAES